MSFQVSYHPEVKKDVSKIPKNLKSRIRKAIEKKLMHDPLRFGDPLKRSLQGYRKLRVGDYRVIYKIQKSIVVILKIGHRKDVYENSRRDDVEKK